MPPIATPIAATVPRSIFDGGGCGGAGAAVLSALATVAPVAG